MDGVTDAVVAVPDKQFELSDLKSNASEKSCYLLIHGKVYDVTPFLDEHPGGERPCVMPLCRNGVHRDTSLL